VPLRIRAACGLLLKLVDVHRPRELSRGLAPRRRRVVHSGEFPSPAAVTGRWDRTSGIFISYRREDAPAYAGRLYDQLAERFGDEHVFMDVDTIEPGADFVARIEDAVGSAAVLLVVMGRGWLESKDEQGRRRLDDPKDFVRLEVASALRRDVRVIPVLVGGARMPEEDELPAALAVLSRRNALVVSDLDWRAGMARLLAVLEPSQKQQDEEEEQEERVPPLPGIPAAATALGIAGAALLILGTALQVDTFAHPEFGPADRDGLGYFTSLAPMGIAVGAVAALLLSFRQEAGALANGLVLGFALAGVARYVAVLGSVNSSPAEETLRVVGGAVLALGGCLLLAAAVLWRSAGDPREAHGEDEADLLPRGLVVLGAALVVAGTIVPFNDGPRIEKQALVERGWDAFEPIGIAVFAVAVSFLLATAGRRLHATGALVGLGFVAVLVWVRLLAVPALQPDTISSPGPGAFLGLAGAGALLLGGLVAHARLTRAALPGGVPAGRAT
jgi:hypothetical protein